MHLGYETGYERNSEVPFGSDSDFGSGSDSGSDSGPDSDPVPVLGSPGACVVSAATDAAALTPVSPVDPANIEDGGSRS